jgi:hypothetical protein
VSERERDGDSGRMSYTGITHTHTYTLDKDSGTVRERERDGTTVR